MQNTDTTNSPTTVTLGDRTFDAEWVGTDDLVAGQTLVVNGPSAGAFWRDSDSVSVVRGVTVDNDRTCTTVHTSDGQEHFGQWSRMRFLVVDGALLG